MQVLERGRQAVLLVEQDAERQMKRLDALRRQPVVQGLDARLVRDRLVREGAARSRLARILAAFAMHVEKVLGFGVVRLEGVVLQRPLGRDAIDVLHGIEVVLAKAEQRRAVDLRVAADAVMQAGVKRLAVFAVPGLGGLIATVDEDLARTPVRGLARQVVAAFDDENALAFRGDSLRQRGAARSASDDDQVVVVSHPWKSPDKASCRRRRRGSCR